MWIVAKYKNKEFEFLKKDFCKILGEKPKFYSPKIKYQKLINKKLKNFRKYLLQGYLICYHSSFEDQKILSKLKYIRGINYFLSGCSLNQNEIIRFIDHCKKNEDNEGYLKQDFFNYSSKTKAKFVSGPFTNMLFEVLEKNKNRFKVLIGKYKVSFSDKKGNLYYPN